MERSYLKLAKKAMLRALALILVFLFADPVSALTPNDPGYSIQSVFLEQINAPAAWEYTTGSRNVVVAVIDTGLDTSHEDLRGNLWTNIHEIPDNKRDDDHNGFVDDVYGWNFVEGNNDVRPSVFNNEDDKEAVRHGTIIAGLIGASGNNGVNGAGVNWKVSLMTLRAIKSNGNGGIEVVSKAVDYAVDNGAEIISLSFIGETPDTGLYNSLRRAYDRGVLIVSASGNFDNQSESGDLNKKPFYPACFDKEDGSGENWIITVGSMGMSGEISDFSNFGNCLDIVAPGEYIYSTERYAPQFGYANEFGGPWFGSSFSTPIVAGAAALLKSIHPEWGPKELISVLLRSADPGNNSPPRLNVGRAVTLAAATQVQQTKGSIFFIRNRNELWKYGLNSGQSELLNRFSDARIISFNIYNNFGYEEAALFLQKKDNYIIRIVDSRGELVKETPISFKPAVFSPQDIKLRFVNGRWRVAGIRYSAVKKNTTIEYFDLGDRQVGKLNTAGQISDWAIGPFGEIIISKYSGSSLRVEALPVKNLPGIKIEIPEVKKIHAISYRDSSRLLALVETGKELSYVQIFLDQNNYVFYPTGLANRNKNWDIKTLIVGDRVFYLPFASEGGQSVVFDNDLLPVLTLRLPRFVSKSQ